MSDSIFDIEQFLDATTTEAGKRRPPLSTDIDYTGTVGDPKVRQSPGKQDPSKVYTFVDFPIALDITSAGSAEHHRVGQDIVTLTHSVSIDFTDSGAMDWSPGKNNGMRAMREATGTNVAGAVWSPRSLVGRMLRVRIKHQEYPEGSGELQDRVRSVSKN